MDPLAITAPEPSDNRITKVEEFVFKPYNNTALNESDEIRISVQTEDLLTLPSNSCLYIEGTFKKTAASNDKTTAKLVNNALAFLFDEIRLDLNGVRIDDVRNVGIASLMKNYASLNIMEAKRLQNAGWDLEGANAIVTNNAFSAVVPLRMLLGFAEDFTQVLLNCRQELILIRSKNTKNATIGTDLDPGLIQITGVEWRMPVVTVEDTEKLMFYKLLEGDTPIRVPFRSWTLYERPSLPQATTHSWDVGTSLKATKPRFIIVGFQTDRNGVTKDASKFDHCNITDLKVYLNGERFPYSNYNLDFKNDKFAMLYEHYARFQGAYYGGESYPLLQRSQFKDTAPLFVIDCSKQKDQLNVGSVHVRIDFTTSENIPAQTNAYCLILHEKVVDYTPLSRIVRDVA